jgi:hypothetical protein
MFESEARIHEALKRISCGNLDSENALIQLYWFSGNKSVA